MAGGKVNMMAMLCKGKILPPEKENCQPVWGKMGGWREQVVCCFKISEDYLSFYGNILIKPHRAKLYHTKRAFDYFSSGS